MNTPSIARNIARLALCLLLPLILAACSNSGVNSTDVGAVRVSHQFVDAVAEIDTTGLYTIITGLDASGSDIFGPVKLTYADEHLLASIPTTVTGLRVEHRRNTGQLLALAQSAVEIRANQTNRTIAVATGAPNNVIVQLINDTDNAGGDAKMFVLFDTPKDSGSVTGIDLLKNSGGATASATGAALSTLWPKGKKGQPTFTSPYTAKARPIYSFTLDDVDSGRLTFSYAEAAAIVNGNAPTASAHYRYDKLEITYLSGAQSGGGNLTAIDFFAIPLQVEVTHWGETTPDPLQTKSIYASTPTVLNALKGLAPNTMGPAFRNTSGAAYHFPATGELDLSDFARVLSPNTIAAAASSGSSAPYPSFGGAKGYLESLVGKTYALNGAQYGGYKYHATFAHDGKGGYTVQCTGTTTVAPAAPLPANAAVTLHLPKDNLDFFIYATVANQSSYSVAGFPFVNTPGSTAQDKVKLANASPYGAIVGDIQAALNFGYLGGRFDSSVANAKTTQDIDAYFSSVLLPYAYPYGGARTTNDGFYNPYAGLFYYLSDAYGHPYSDRLAAASPLYSLQAGDTVRITILNDHRLDAPLVTVKSATSTSLNLSWPSVANATGYTLALSPKPAKAPASFSPQAGATQSHSITGLAPGTSYLVSVTATGKNAGKAIQSAVLPVQGVTHAAAQASADVAASAGENPSFKLSLGLTPNFSSMSYEINGQPVAFGDDANVQGVIGMNALQLSVLDEKKAVVYRGTYFINLSAAAAGHFDVAAPFTLEYNLTPLTQAGPPGTPPYPLGPNLPLTVGTPFTPKPYYQYFEVKFP